MKRSARRALRRGAIATLVAIAAGCSSVLGGSPPAGDGGTGPAEDSGPASIPDEGVGVDGGSLTDGPSIPQKLVVVHAAPGLPPFRLCFATALPERVIAVLSIPPLPDTASAATSFPGIGSFPAVPDGTPGIFPGTLGALASSSVSSLPDFSPTQVRPFVVLASSIANETADAGPDGGAEETCDTLIGRHGLGPIDVPSPGRLVPGTDFWELETVPIGAFASGQTYLLSVTGCVPPGLVRSDGGAGADADAADDGGADPDTGAAQGDDAGSEDGATPPAPLSACGAGYDGGVNVGLGIVQLDTSSPVDGGIGVQFAHRASALEATEVAEGDAVVHPPASAGVVASFFRVFSVDGGAEAGAILQFAPIPPDSGTGPGLDGGAGSGLDGGSAGTGAVFFSASGIFPSTAAVVNVDPTDPTVSFGVVVLPLDASAPNMRPFPAGDVIALPLSTIQRLSSWGATTDASPNGFQVGYAYTFVLVGDPRQQPATAMNPDGGASPYDGRGLHLLAFPNVFTPKGL